MPTSGITTCRGVGLTSAEVWAVVVEWVRSLWWAPGDHRAPLDAEVTMKTLTCLAVSLALAGLALAGPIGNTLPSKVAIKVGKDRRAVAVAHAPFIPPEARRRAEALRIEEARAHHGKFIVEVGPRKWQDEELALHTRLAGTIARANPPAPPGRLAHFQWLNQEHGLQVVAWHGRVDDAVPTPAGGWIVTLKVVPFVGSATSTTVLDFYHERYELGADGTLTFLQGIDPPNAHRGIIID